MGTVVLDEKGRITLPAKFREECHLKPMQKLVFNYKGSKATLTPPRKLSIEDDPLLREFALRPLKGRKVTCRKLEKMTESLWSR